ncbi:MAG TPA: hypothetical protein VK358_09335 [Longimicrobium sp.]|nr:hypothetical protein [Longimicrobium sp.]
MIVPATFLDSTDAGVDAWAQQFGLQLAEAHGLRMVSALRESLDPGPGPRTGREYTVPGTKTKVRASAAGEHPAVREGTLRDSFQLIPAHVDGDMIRSGASSSLTTGDGEYHIAAILNNGTDDGRIEPRPFIDHTLEQLAEELGGEVVR